MFFMEFCVEIIVLPDGSTCIAYPNKEVLPFEYLGKCIYLNIMNISCSSNWVDSNNNLAQYIYIYIYISRKDQIRI